MMPVTQVTVAFVSRLLHVIDQLHEKCCLFYH